MKNFSKIIRSSTFRSIVLSYLLILIVPSLMGIASYIISARVVRNEVTALHEITLDQACDTIDAQIISVVEIAAGLSTNPRVQSLFFTPDEKLTPKNLYTGVEIQRDFRSLMLSNRMVKSMDIYFNRAGYMLGNMSRTPPEKLDSVVFERFGMEGGDFVALCGKSNRGNVSVIAQERAPADILVAVSLAAELDTPATLLVVIDGRTLSAGFAELKEIQGGRGHVFVNTGENLLLDADFYARELSALEVVLPSYAELGGSPAVFEQKGPDGRRMIVHMRSDYLGWEFISAVPSAVFFAKAQFVLKLLYVYVAVCLLAGSGLVYFYSRRSYYRIRRISSLLRGGAEATGDEFGFLEGAVTSMLSSQRSLEERLSRHQSDIRYAALQRLIQGNIPFENTEDIYAVYGIRFSGDFFRVLIFSFADYGESFSPGGGYGGENPGEADTEDSELLAFAIQNVMQESQPEGVTSEMFTVRDAVVCISNAATESALGSRLDEGVARVSDIFESKLNVTLACATSNTAGGFESIAGSYMAASHQLDSILMSGKTQAERPDPVLELRMRYIKSLSAGDYQAAKALFRLIAEQGGSSVSPEAAVLFRHAMAETLLVALRRSPSAEKGSDSVAAALYSLDSTDALLNRADELFDCLHMEGGDQPHISARSSMGEITEFLRENFTDPSLSLSSVADRFSLNSSYLSHIFKKQTGVGILEYIQRLRTARAKQLLITTALDLSGIAEQCGFYSAHALGSIFKKFESIPPGKYRSLYSSNIVNEPK